MRYNSGVSYNTPKARYNTPGEVIDVLEQIKNDVSEYSGIAVENLKGFTARLSYFMAVINSNVNVSQYNYKGYGQGPDDLPDLLYQGVLIPMLGDYYLELQTQSGGIIKSITEGDSGITYDVSALLKSIKKNYRPIFSHYRKLVAI